MRDRTIHDGPFAPALREAADAMIAGRANVGDAELLDLLHDRRGLRSRQVEGLSMLISAVQEFISGNDTHCWWYLLEAMVSGDEVAEVNARVSNGRVDILRAWRPEHGLQRLASEILLLGDCEA